MTTIAIDGPVGAGKSSIAKEIAKRLGFLYLDTGACYRAIAYWATSNSVDIGNENNVADMLENIKMEIKHIDGAQRTFINDQDVSDYLRTPQIADATSIVSAQSAVREWLIDVQRGVAENCDVVMDGRDIGTVIIPNADLKIYLTAKPEERARRRHEEYLANGRQISYNDVLLDLIERDQRDMSREIAPLKKASDAVEVDTTEINFEQTVNAILNLVDGRI